MNNSLNVLIIEDNPVHFRLVEELLKEYDQIQFVFFNTTTLLATQKLLKTAAIDIILLDLGLTESQGIETFRQLNLFALDIPIIILAMMEDEQTAITTIAEGAQDYLVKGSFNGNQLARAMLFAIERKQNENIVIKYAGIIENTNDAIFSLDMNGIVTSWNRAAENIFQYPAHEIIGQPFAILCPKANKESLNSILSLIKIGGVASQYEITLINQENREIDCLINISPLKNKFETIIGSVIAAIDYTSRKKLEQQSAIQLRVAAVLAELSSLSNIAHNIIKIICEILDFQAGEIWAHDPKKDVLIYVSSWSNYNLPLEYTEITSNLVFKKGEGTPGIIWQTMRSYWNTDISHDQENTRKNLLKKMKLNCLLGFPIIYGEELLGVILFFGHKLTQPDVSMMIMFEVIGKQIGTFLKRKRLENSLLHLAQHDLLTGLANKLATEATFISSIADAKKKKTLIAFLYLDLDHFKNINDTLGHQKGDLVLQEVARRLEELTRESDLVARFGGDEFAVLLFGVKSREIINSIVNKILSSIALPYVIDKLEFFLSASIGISIYPHDGKDISSLLIAADLAMYNAKKMGGNNYQYSSLKLEKMEQKKLFMESRLHQAFKNNEFSVYYQPIVNVQTNHIEGVEALLRWKTEKGQLIPPAEFIPLLEQSRLISFVGEWVLKTACLQMQQWQQEGFHSVSVNVSIHQLTSKFINIISNILNETGLNPKHLIIEITESMLMKETEISMKIINTLNKMGILTSIDDFGTGYSSFAYLQSYNFRNLKIDKSFITNINKNEASNSIIKAIIAMAKALKLSTIAEGVETKEQLDFLKESGCDQYQGYYYSRPLPPDKLMIFLQKKR